MGLEEISGHRSCRVLTRLPESVGIEPLRRKDQLLPSSQRKGCQFYSGWASRPATA
jgi:hypothetical protein